MLSLVPFHHMRRNFSLGVLLSLTTTDGPLQLIGSGTWGPGGVSSAAKPARRPSTRPRCPTCSTSSVGATAPVDHLDRMTMTQLRACQTTAARASAALTAVALTLSSLPLPAQTPAARRPRPAAAARFRGAPVTLNFVNADIEGVARAMAAILRQQFVVDPRVRGTITLYSEEPLTPREAYLNFLAALRGLGFTVVEVGGIFKVVPEADAKLQTGTVAVGERRRAAATRS